MKWYEKLILFVGVVAAIWTESLTLMVFFSALLVAYAIRDLKKSL